MDVSKLSALKNMTPNQKKQLKGARQRLTDAIFNKTGILMQCIGKGQTGGGLTGKSVSKLTAAIMIIKSHF